jgi:hypothetical protein|tara:strand:+ start:821 stop:970 length:150 start_codon:yes stop_codon:yes gene_type:complete
MCKIKNHRIKFLEKKIKSLEGKINPYKVTANNFLLEHLYKELKQLKPKQ